MEKWYPTDLPKDLRVYLSATSKPSEIFSTLQEARSRRTCLLLRRFTNQIQYGCKNPSCDVKTCLSNRRRHASTPLRPYSDVAARALAWQCLEDYATANRQVDSENTSFRRRDRSRLQQERSIKCLCWNEPVVPWYEDPSDKGRWNKIIHKATSGIQNSVSLPAGFHMGNKGRTQPSLAEGHPQGRSFSASGDVKASVTVSSHTSASLNSSLQLPSTNTMQFDAQSGSSIGKQDYAPFVSAAETIPIDQRRSRIKDSASFTQTLWDTASIRGLEQWPLQQDWFQKSQSGGRKDDFSLAAGTVNPPVSGSYSEYSALHGPPSSISPVSTFKVLPLSTILWLRGQIPSDAQISAHRDLSRVMDRGESGLFARQSVHFCLGNPTILLRSVATWHFIHPHPIKMDVDARMQAIHDLLLREKLSLNQGTSAPLASFGGIMVAVGMLVAITSIPEVLDHLFAALQHAYILPRRLAQTLDNKSTLFASTGQDKQGYTLDEDNQSGKKPKAREVKYLEDEEVARLCTVVFLALQLILSIKPQSFAVNQARPSKDFSELFASARKLGVIFPQSHLAKGMGEDPNQRPVYQSYTARTDASDGLSFQRLLDGVADVISHRLGVQQMCRLLNERDLSQKSAKSMVSCVMDEITKSLKVPEPWIHKQSLQITLLEVLQSIMSRQWDRSPVIRKSGAVGGALELLAAMYKRRVELSLSPASFQWDFVAEPFDDIDMPTKWLDFQDDHSRTHILAYSFLFQPSKLVTYFRAINSSLMRRAYNAASIIHKHAEKFLHTSDIPVYGAEEVLSEIRPNMAKFFVLTVRRTNMLQDAMDQLWHRQRQELTRPLKVRLGKDEGEDGLDHGGVQAEFFRLVFAEALDPQYGMFTIDERTKMTWIQPESLEPLYKFEALGLLMSLAVYNGITLPTTFPLAFYRKLLGLKVKTIQHIKDGWPDLARGLQILLDWNDGDVGEVIGRTYEFSYEAYGSKHTVNMTQIRRNDPWPNSRFVKAREKSKQTSFGLSPQSRGISPGLMDENDPYFLEASAFTLALPVHVKTLSEASSTTSSVPSSPQASASPKTSADVMADQEAKVEGEGEEPFAPLVTNANREQYVKDYIHWLTHKSISPQFNAFITGFHTCLSRTALSIFTPDHLQLVIEGHQQIDIDELHATATYDDYSVTDEVIQWFWQVVRDMSPPQHKQLLEFVTASDRVPVNGLKNVVFIIQRNGEGDERLPSSSTCYGRLLLPKYSAKEVLRVKLEKAVENSIGFGSL